MKKYKYVIVGGGVAGTTAAFQLRKNSEDPIVIIGDEPTPLYNRILLPHLLKKTIEKDKVFLKKIEDYSDHNIVYMPGVKALSLDLMKKILSTTNGEISFEKLIFATGTRPKDLRVAGEKLKNITHLQYLSDTDLIAREVQSLKNAIVVGSGFIALEFVGILSKLGVNTKLIMRGEKLFGGIFDDTADRILADRINSLGVDIIRGTEIVEFIGNEAVSGVKLKDGEALDSDFIGLGVGVTRNIELAKNAGLKVETGVVTDEFLTTSHEEIFAAGDVSEFRHGHEGQIVLGNWSNAQNQGRHVASVLSGEKTPYEPISSYSTSAVGINITFLGVTNDPSATVVNKGSFEEKSYSRVFVKDGQAIGAVFINRVAEVSEISQLIKDKTKIK